MIAADRAGEPVLHPFDRVGASRPVVDEVPEAEQPVVLGVVVDVHEGRFQGCEASVNVAGDEVSSRGVRWDRDGGRGVHVVMRTRRALAGRSGCRQGTVSSIPPGGRHGLVSSSEPIIHRLGEIRNEVVRLNTFAGWYIWSWLLVPVACSFVALLW